LDDPSTNYFLDLFDLHNISINTAIIPTVRFFTYLDDAVTMFSIHLLEDFLFQHLRCENYYYRVSKFLVGMYADAYKFVVLVEEFNSIFY
jgi:hypothetical protein